MKLSVALRQHVAALRALVVLTAILGIAYPLVVLLIAQVPGLKAKADGSLVTVNHATVGSSLIGQSFVDSAGTPVAGYFQSRPSAAGAGYDPTSTGGSNLGPESIVDTLPDPADKTDAGKQSLLTQVCARSKAVGDLEGVDGRRAYCTADGVGAVLSVTRASGLTGAVTKVVSVNQECPAKPFVSTYEGITVTCATYGADYRAGTVALIRGPGKSADNPVPADAVTASASGLDPDISVAYADLQAPRVAKARSLTVGVVRALIAKHTTGRTLGFIGQPAVNVLELNLALDRLSSTS